MSTQPRRAPRALSVAATIAACLAAAAIPATSASGDEAQPASWQPRMIEVKGSLTLVDADRGEYEAKGDLVGTWTIPPKQAIDYYNTPTVIIQKGPESFAGCLQLDRKKKRCGTLNSEYISWSYLKPKPSGQLISGGCTHAPTGGTRVFTGVRGLIQMTDSPVGDEVVTLYEGQLILNAEREEGPMPIPHVPAGGAAAATSSAAATGAC